MGGSGKRETPPSPLLPPSLFCLFFPLHLQSHFHAQPPGTYSDMLEMSLDQGACVDVGFENCIDYISAVNLVFLPFPFKSLFLKGALLGRLGGSVS